jgi:hypothetical protein
MHDEIGAPVLFVSIIVAPARTTIIAEVPAIDVDSVATGILAHHVAAELRGVPVVEGVGSTR